MKKLFVLTTRTSQWFVERGFSPAAPDALPTEKRALYNWQRRSKVLVKPL
jgi:amino-acid N-acetyltransferase